MKAFDGLIKNQHFTKAFVIHERPLRFKPTLLAAHNVDAVCVLLQMQEEGTNGIAIFFKGLVKARDFNYYFVGFGGVRKTKKISVR